MRRYIEESSLRSNPFSKRLSAVFGDFIAEIWRLGLLVDDLNSDRKDWSLSLFAERSRQEEFGENYSVNYLASFAQLAQAQRHRTISYEMSLIDDEADRYHIYFTPPIIREDQAMVEEWARDIESLAEFYPQGMLVLVNERGTLENFKRKCQERLCGAAQLEIFLQTNDTLERYLKALKDSQKMSPYRELAPYSGKLRCQFLEGWHCDRPCAFGPEGAKTRKV